jgi:hypothetical protein
MAQTLLWSCQDHHRLVFRWSLTQVMPQVKEITMSKENLWSIPGKGYTSQKLD